MGTLAFHSDTPFNVVRIAILCAPQGTTDFMVDSINVPTVAGASYAVATSASPSDGGSTAGGGAYSNGSQVTVVATAKPGYAFVNWTEGGTVMSSSASYSFTASADRTLGANFSPRLAVTESAPDAIALSWPAPSAGFILQQNSACAPTGWVNVTATVNVVGGQNRVTVSPTVGNRFFRLFHP